MTINDFIDSFIREAGQTMKDISFVDVNGKEKRIKGYPQELPYNSIQIGWEQEDTQAKTEEDFFPYFLVQISEIEYEDQTAKAKVWILLAVYDDSQDMRGWKNINNAVECLISRFRINPVLKDYYFCEKNMKVAYSDQGDWPHFFAGIEMTWNLPNMKEEM